MVSTYFQCDILDGSVSFVSSQIALLKTHITGYMHRDKFKWHARMVGFLKTVDGLDSELKDGATTTFKIGKSKGTVTDTNRSELYDFVAEYATALHECVDERFPDDETVAAFGICEPKNMEGVVDLDTYGADEIKLLSNHYSSFELIDGNITQTEWIAVKKIMVDWRKSNPAGSLFSFMKHLWTHHKGKFPSMEVIFEITAILPFANAVSERGFSAMKFLKGNRSANMTTGEGITGDDADDDDAEDDADRDASADSLDTSNNNKKKVHNTLETRIHLFLNTPARGTSEHEKLIDETTVAFWGLRKRVPKRAKGAHAANEVRRRKGDEKRAKRKKEKDDILTGASAESVADGSLHASESRSTFAPPSGHELVELKDVPELDEEFTMNVKKPKIAHRDDDDDWMLGTVKKHKIMTRTGPTGASKRARIEFQFANATQTAFFRLRTKDYGPQGEWALFKAKANAAQAAKKAAKKAKKGKK